MSACTIDGPQDSSTSADVAGHAAIVPPSAATTGCSSIDNCPVDMAAIAAQTAAAGAPSAATPSVLTVLPMMSAGNGSGPIPAAGMSGESSTIPVRPIEQLAANGGQNAPQPAAGQGGSTTPPQQPADPRTADIETCYELRAHGQSAPADPSKYALPPGETYTSFLFKAPWTQPVQALRFRHLPDNAAVVHHWILYTETAGGSDGDIQECDLGGLFGFLCGQGTTRSMITGWAPGRGDFLLPEGVGLELPAPGALLALEFHYNNFKTGETLDQSGAEVCVTSKFRPNTASITWLGTESIRIQPNSAGAATGTCNPQRKGLNANDPIHVLYSWPHMHKLGTHLTSLINRAGGTQETLHDAPFSFDYQQMYDTPALLQAGDTISTTCMYQNTTAAAVSFGQSTVEEMCFNFLYAWPAHALDNPNGKIGEALNTCLH